MKGDEGARGQERRREHQREKMRGETVTCEMLSGLVADMTALVPIDRAISLPSPVARYSPVWHSTLSFRALF